MADPQSFRFMFEHLPDVFFFVKDEQSRMIAASSAVFERLGLNSEADMIGRSDADFFPKAIASGFRRDDLTVIREKKPLVNRMEVWYDHQRQLDWFVTTKLPVYDRSGQVIGVMGVTRPDTNHLHHGSRHEISSIIEFIKKNCSRSVSTSELAEHFAMSERTLNRKVKQYVGASPYELVLRIRIQLAAEALLSDDAPITELAAKFGFCDQSAFTVQFRKRIGMTPLQFRKRHA